MNDYRENPDKVAHVVPSEPEPEHRIDGFCWCQPTVEDVPPEGRMYLHRRVLDYPIGEGPNA